MTEYYRIDGQPLTIHYEVEYGTQSVVYTVFDLANSEYIYYDEGINNGDGSFGLVLPADITRYDRDLVIETQIIGTDSYTTDSLDVTLVRQFITIDHLSDYGIAVAQEPVDETPTQINLSTYYKLERKARSIIKAITNQEFKFEYKTVGSYGNGIDSLYLGQRVESFDKITYDDYVVYDTTADPEIDELGATLAIAPSKTALKVVAPGVNIAEWVDQNPIRNPSYFGQDSAYLVRGEYGWKELPEDIVICTYELMNDYLCNDYIYRNKGLKSIQNDAFTIQFADGMLNGTGNLYVDTLLARYKDWNLKAI